LEKKRLKKEESVSKDNKRGRKKKYKKKESDVEGWIGIINDNKLQ
jgi:hypothetical protein